jgi:hypothetical protein
MVDTQRAEQRPAAAPTGYSADLDATDPRVSAMRRIRQAAALGVLALAVLGYASFEFVGHATASGPVRATTTAQPTAVDGPVSSPRTTAAPATVAPVPSASHSAPSRATAAAPRPQTIRPVGVAAFGPSGIAGGDNQQNARNIITDPASGWQSAWYTTASFGGLQVGTGLLLDMGRNVTVTSVRLTLGGPPGARLQLRLGGAPALAGLRVAATVTAASDLLTIRLTKPVVTRYVLVWFTRLPPDGSGTYQAFVHQVTVDGRR